MLTDLHNAFAKFMDNFADVDPRVGSAKLPSFFFEQFDASIKIAVPDGKVIEPLPYDDFYLCFDAVWPVKTMLFVRVAASKTVADGFHLIFWIPSPKTGKWTQARMEKQTEENQALLPAMVEQAITRINHCERSESSSPARDRINLLRTRSAKSKRKPALSMFIDIAAPSPDQINADGGTGRTMSPHDRRGHWRELSSGRQVWVRSAAINGGGEVSQHYKV
ncbi:MAG: hypothetical protein AABZ76_07275 [Pseudomonadota bacterium]